MDTAVQLWIKNTTHAGDMREGGRGRRKREKKGRERDGGRWKERYMVGKGEGRGSGKGRSQERGTEVEDIKYKGVDGCRIHTMIFFPLNSSMIHDLPTSCPAPLQRGGGADQHWLGQIWGTHRGRIVSKSLSSAGPDVSALRLAMVRIYSRVRARTRVQSTEGN